MAAPVGNRNAARAAEYRHALDLELRNYEANGIRKGMALRLVARGQIAKAIAGDTQAAKDIADRLDGKPAQTIQGPDGGHVVIKLVAGD